MTNQVIEQIEKVKDNFRKYWRLENEEPLITVKAVRDMNEFKASGEKFRNSTRHKNSFMANADPTTNFEGQFNLADHLYYAGDTMPSINSGLCVSVSTGFLGNAINFDNQAKSIWQDHEYANRELSEIEFSEDNVWWVIQKNLIKAAVQKCAETKVPLGLPVDLFSGMDSLMMLRGTENLCMDLIMQPDEVKKACEKIHIYWDRWIDEFFGMSEPYVEGNSISWLNVWGEGRTFCIQSDFMSLISADMYEEFVLPGIHAMCKKLDNVLFHFDGPDHVKRHLPFLLDMPEIGAIQWNPAINYENARHLDTLREIQKAGKGLVLNAKMSEVEELVKGLSPQGLLINVEPFDGFKTPEEADEIVKTIKNFCK